MKLISKVSSPAKAILCGEHAVVYGEDAIAFAVNLRCFGNIYVENIASEQKQEEIIQIVLKNKDKQSKVKYYKKSYQIAQKMLQTSPAIKNKQQQTIQNQNVKSKQDLLDFHQFQKIFQKQIQQKLSTQKCQSQYLATINFKISIFYLIYQINPFKRHNSKFVIQIDSEIPIGKCLGSSASFNTVLASSLLIIYGSEIQKLQSLFKKIENSKNFYFDKNSQIIFNEQTNYLSKLFQKVQHGTPSGIDNFVSVFGGVVLYNKSKQPKFIRIQDQKIIKKLTQDLIIGFEDSFIPKNTKQAVSNVRQKYLQHTNGNQKYKNMIEQIGKISNEVIEILEQDQNWVQKLFQIVQKNHNFLKQLGLSNEKIQQIVSQNTINSKVCSKITGSGMGGFVLILSLKSLRQQFQKNQNILITTISKQGLLIDFMQ